jgi:hypothetical protein
MHQILLRSEVSFSSLHGCVSQEHLDLLKLPAGGPVHLRACPPEIVRGDTRQTDRRRILLEQLPHYFSLKTTARTWSPRSTAPNKLAIGHAGSRGPAIDRFLDPGRHRNRADAAVLPYKVHDAPPGIRLLDVPECYRGDFRPSQSAAQKHREDGTIAESSFRRRIGRI